MERESTKHGPRLDEEMEREAQGLTHAQPRESHSRGERLTDDLPDDAAIVAGTVRDEVTLDSPLSPSEVELRAELARRLAAAPWPASRPQILEAAGPDLPPDIVDRLGRLPDGRYPHFQSVWDALGGHHENRGHAAS
jgi:hypothetical protein